TVASATTAAAPAVTTRVIVAVAAGGAAPAGVEALALGAERHAALRLPGDDLAAQDFAVACELSAQLYRAVQHTARPPLRLQLRAVGRRLQVDVRGAAAALHDQARSLDEDGVVLAVLHEPLAVNQEA